MTDSHHRDRPKNAGTPPNLLCADDIEKLMIQLAPGWHLCEDGLALCRNHNFPDFHHTMAFVNALAWIAHQQNHHPDLQVAYSRCSVRLSTHESGGLTHRDRDFALKLDALLSGGNA